MTKTWSIINGSIALITFLLGISVLVFNYYIFSIYNEYVTNGLMEWNLLSIRGYIFQFNFHFLYSILLVLSGYLLWNKKYSGWLLGISSYIILLALTVYAVFTVINDDDYLKNETLAIYSAIAGFALSILILLIQKPMRYKTNWKNIILIMLIAGMLTIDFIYNKIY